MKLKKENKYYLWLIIILLVAFVLRFYRLGTLLPLFGDEVDMGYNSYSILKTGKDITGHFLPVYLKTLIDIKLSLLAYFSTIPIYFLGLNELSVRLIPALSGLLIVLLGFAVAWQLSKNKAFALMAAFLLAVAPWAIHFSRGAFEANLMVFLLLLGIYLFLLATKRKIFLLLSALALALSLYAYHAAKILAPLIIIGLCFFFKDQLRNLGKKNLVWGLIIFVLVSLPILYASFFGSGQQRFSEVSLFRDNKVIDQIVTKRQADVDLSLPSRFFHNKGEAYFQKMAANYFESFSPQFLFLNGDLNFRHSSGGNGELYLLLLPFFLIGLFSFFKERKKYQKFLIYLMLIAPLPSVITKDGGQHAIRLLFLMPIILMIIAFGFIQFFLWLKKNLKQNWLKIFVYVFLILFFIFNFVFYLHQYFWHYPKESWRYWAYGYQQAMLKMKNWENDYDLVVINNSYEPSILWFLFWTKYDPQKLIGTDIQHHVQENIISGANGFYLGKYLFIKPNNLEWRYRDLTQIFKGKQKVLFLASAREDTAGDKDLREYPPKGVKVIDVVTSPEGQPIFYFLAKDDDARLLK